jgi:hypothetical protein
MDMSVALIKGVTKYLPSTRIAFDKFHVVAHASGAVDRMRRLEQKTDPSLKGLRGALLKDRRRLTESQRADLETFVVQPATKRTAWLCPEAVARHPRPQADRRDRRKPQLLQHRPSRRVTHSRFKRAFIPELVMLRIASQLAFSLRCLRCHPFRGCRNYKRYRARETLVFRRCQQPDYHK